MYGSHKPGLPTGDLPPSSSVTFFRLEEAATFMIARPVFVEPVNAILSTSM